MKGFLLRIPIYLAILLLGIYAAETVVPELDGRKDLPVGSDAVNARNMLYKSLKHGAKDYFPLEYDDAEYVLDQARKAVNAELAQNWFVRDFTYSSGKLSEAEDKVSSLLLKTARRENGDRIESEAKLRQLEAILREGRALLEHTSISTLARQRYTTADLHYKNARDAFARNKYGTSLKQAHAGIKSASMAMETSRSLLSRYSDPALLAKWKSWKNRAIESSRISGVAIVVTKEKHRLDLYRNGSLSRSFDAELGANSINQKMYAGDRATPEGYYSIIQKKGHGQSKYNCALLINYPNGDDRHRFNTLKSRHELGRGSKIGGLIEIHGEGGKGFDWTDGCVALTDREMEWLFKATPVGTAVAIIGSDGNGGPISSALNGSGGNR
ncbi:MAG TPA: L,D-transpeptidase [Acidobacteriota bacterium]|jgi:L,D-peptidoglycan transpeptidase YkuD (ErfK/YbiS/YcfS/YnhG family)|nr:L,D-transpeptidase [Acidobacteriota bacterium]HNT18438.1 L,D-transpeptidase [Acidobacteriota bacterium]HQO20244.1 L,D-transpeptidase [Acidobacteriota bacterium]HQQ46913.1 L,D-transpeptidase [Acidobacteriota bacterium]